MAACTHVKGNAGRCIGGSCPYNANGKCQYPKLRPRPKPWEG